MTMMAFHTTMMILYMFISATPMAMAENQHLRGLIDAMPPLPPDIPLFPYTHTFSVGSGRASGPQASLLEGDIMIRKDQSIALLGEDLTQKLEEDGFVFTTDNGAESITYPDGGITPFRGGKLTTWEGGMRAPMLIRWPGHIKAGTNPDQIFSSLDWVPTLVNIAGGPKGDGLKKQIEAGKYPGIVKTTLDGFDQRDYLEGKADSARDTFFYYTGAQPSAVRYKNWKFYYTMVSSNALEAFNDASTYHWTQVNNLKRDPFERSVASAEGTLLGYGGALAAPSTAFIYDWNLLPIGQLLWLKELETYRTFPSLQVPASYNLDNIIHAMQDAKHISHQGH